MTASTSLANTEAFDQDIFQWQPAKWEDYLHHLDTPTTERVGLYFDGNYLFIDMGSEGINHSTISDLFTVIFGLWFSIFAEETANSMGRCLMEKPGKQAASPDLVLYIGADYPQWQQGEKRRINLDQWRVPDLVGEISGTTLAMDLDEKKQLYADLEIPEYWVIDVQGVRVSAFRLQEDGRYQQIAHSVALEGLPIPLLDQTLVRLGEGTNISAASWLMRALRS